MLGFFRGTQFSNEARRAHDSSHLQLFFEKSVNSFSGVMKEVNQLDLDSGIRADGKYGGKKTFIFVTRSPHDGYTLMVYWKKPRAKGFVPDKRVLVKEFGNQEDLGGFMRKLLAKPVRAFVY